MKEEREKESEYERRREYERERGGVRENEKKSFAYDRVDKRDGTSITTRYIYLLLVADSISFQNR